MRSGRVCWWTCTSVACGIFWASGGGPLPAQPGGSLSGSQFELAETVQLDQVDHAVLAQWERAKALLADRQWDEAIEILGQLAESSAGKLLAVTNRRYVSLRAWCQLQLAALPPEALKLYRHRVDTDRPEVVPARHGRAEPHAGCRRSSIRPLPAAMATRR